MVLLVGATVSSSWNSRFIGAALADDPLEAIPLLELRAQVRVLRFQPPLLERGVEHVQQFVDLEGLADEVRRAALDRLDRVLHRPVAGDDDRDDVRIAPDGRFDHRGAIDAGEAQVGDDDVEGEVGQLRDRHLAGIRLFDPIAAVASVARRSLRAAAPRLRRCSRCFCVSDIYGGANILTPNPPRCPGLTIS